MNKHLEGKGVTVDNLDESLKNGLNLIHALEHATGDAAPKYHQKATLPVHCIDNQNVALKFLADHGVNTGGVTAEGEDPFFHILSFFFLSFFSMSLDLSFPPLNRRSPRGSEEEDHHSVHGHPAEVQQLISVDFDPVSPSSHFFFLTSLILLFFPFFLFVLSLFCSLSLSLLSMESLPSL